MQDEVHDFQGQAKQQGEDVIINSTYVQKWLQELEKHSCKYSFYSLKIYNELKKQEINLPWTEQSPKTFIANCKSYNKSSSGFTAIIKFEFMHIVSPVPLREYNVKFSDFFV